MLMRVLLYSADSMTNDDHLHSDRSKTGKKDEMDVRKARATWPFGPPLARCCVACPKEGALDRREGVSELCFCLMEHCHGTRFYSKSRMFSTDMS